MLSRIIYGARIALVVGIVAVLLAMVIGVTLGLVAGYYGGWVDVVIMRVMDGLFAFPIIILAIAMMAVMGFGVKNVIIAVAVGLHRPLRARDACRRPGREGGALHRGGAPGRGVGGPPSSRATCCRTCSRPSSCRRRCASPAPSSRSPGSRSSGSGPPPPTPVWGSMIAEGRNFIVMAPHVSTIPGIALMVTIVGLNLLGDGLRDTLDPRLRR